MLPASPGWPEPRRAQDGAGVRFGWLNRAAASFPAGKPSMSGRGRGAAGWRAGGDSARPGPATPLARDLGVPGHPQAPVAERHGIPQRDLPWSGAISRPLRAFAGGGTAALPALQSDPSCPVRLATAPLCKPPPSPEPHPRRPPRRRPIPAPTDLGEARPGGRRSPAGSCGGRARLRRLPRPAGSAASTRPAREPGAPRPHAL